jgi:adenine deaminase
VIAGQWRTGGISTYSKEEYAAREAAQRQRLVEVALGRAPADLVIRGGRLVNVYTGEIEEGLDVAVAGERIALVGDGSGCIGLKTKVVDARGAYLVPGFIDSHYHIESSRMAPWRHAEVTLPHGITVLVEDPHEACAPGGLDAIRYILENTEDLKQKVYVQVSSATPPSNVETTGGYIGGEELRKALTWPRVIGLGEMMDAPRIYSGDTRQWGLLEAAYRCWQSIEGHGGYSGKHLSAYASAGVRSTHNTASPEWGLEMLRRGFDIQLQVGREVETIKMLLNSQIDWTRVGLAVDDRPVQNLLEKGGLDNEVREAIRLGVPEICAYQMATLNNARHWGFERDHGSINPGRYADILFITDLRDVTISRVYANGVEVARDGALTLPIPHRPAPLYAVDSIHLKRPVTAEDFAVRVPRGRAQAGTVEAVVIPPYTWTGDVQEIRMRLPVRDGLVQPDFSRGIHKAAVVERHRATGNIGLGFWQWGLRRGAIATSVMHDSHNIAVIGANDPDMALAVNRVAEIGGGIVVAGEGKILAELALPVWGLMSDAPPREVAEEYSKVESAARTLFRDGLNLLPADKMRPSMMQGLREEPADQLTFAFLTCYPRRYMLTDRGIFDMWTETPVPLIR